MRNYAVGRVEEQALDRYLHDCEATGHAMCSDLGSSCNEDSPLCEQARQALWDSRRAEHDWSRFDVRQELVRLGSSFSDDRWSVPALLRLVHDSFTIRSCRAAGARRGARQLQWADSMRTLPSWEACSSALRAVVSSCWAASLDSATARKVFSSVVLVLSRPSGRSRWMQ